MTILNVSQGPIIKYRKIGLQPEYFTRIQMIEIIDLVQGRPQRFLGIVNFRYPTEDCFILR